MAFVFVITFFAMVAGIIKPYVNGLSRKHFGIGALVSFILVGVSVPNSATTAANGNSDSNSISSGAPDTGQPSIASQPSPPVSKWEYSNTTDEMRGTTSRVAQVTSDNIVDLDFPYGEVHGRLWVRRRGGELNAAFEVEKGQILCHEFSESYVSIKFDDGPIRRFRCAGASDGSSNVAFLSDASHVLAGIRRAKRTIVEAEFYQRGREQFTFNTAMLNWK